jgi:hypothetical protein
MSEEVWKDIKETNGRYQVSNRGRVRNKKKLIKQFDNGNGYMYVRILVNNKPTNKRVSRLVAQAFLRNPNNYLFVNHIDENRKNNNVDNLEWCSIKYNNNFGKRIEKYKKARYKSINQYSLNGDFIKKWNSIKEISQKLNISASGITSCAKRKFKQFKGYVWRYEK